MLRVIAREIAANLLMGIPPIARRRIREGRTSAAANVKDLQRKAFGLIHPRIESLIPGARVMEIGPGDHLATGLALLAYGARSYAALDRFPGDYRSSHAMGWYRLLREHWATRFPDRPWPAGLDDFPDVPNVSELPLSTEDIERLPQDAYDLVLSQAVGEHVRDIDAFAQATYRMLAPGGTALHEIDFSCHGFFAEDPLRFLIVPGPVWHLMGSNRGLPNRRRLHEYLAAFRRQPFSEVELVHSCRLDVPIPAALAGVPEDSARTYWAIVRLVK